MIPRNFRLNVLTAASLLVLANGAFAQADSDEKTRAAAPGDYEIGRASCRERV